MKDETIKFEVASVDNTLATVEEIRFRQIDGGTASFAVHETRRTYRGNFAEGDIVALTTIKSGKQRTAEQVAEAAREAAQLAAERAEAATEAAQKAQAELAEAQARIAEQSQSQQEAITRALNESKHDDSDQSQRYQQAVASTEAHRKLQREEGNQSGRSRGGKPSNPTVSS